MHVHIILLITFVALAYINSLPAAFVSDDLRAIVENPNINNYSSIFEDPSDIIQSFLNVTIYKVFGPTPLVYRLVTIVFHLGSVITLYILLTRFFHRLAAFFGASIFAVHPVLTESVVWISGGHYVRYGFFFLVSLLFYIDSPKNKSRYILSLAAYILALISSAMAVALPIVLIAYNWIKRREKESFLMIIPYFVLTAIDVFLYMQAVSPRLSTLSSLGYTLGDVYQYNALYLIPIALTTYLQLIVFPLNLSFYHVDIYSWFEVGVRTVILAAVAIASIFIYRKNKLLGFWLAFFVITLIVVVNPLRIASSSIAERYIYLASVGIIAPIGYLLYVLSKKYKELSLTVFTILMLIFTARTFIRNSDWLTHESFWLSTVKTAPGSYQAQNNAGQIYFERGEVQASIAAFQKAIAISPDIAESHYNLGMIYFTTGQYDAALKEYNEAARLNPQLHVVYQNIAAVYFEKQDFERSEAFTLKALEFTPESLPLRLNLGLIYLRAGNKSEAQKVFKQILTIDPTSEAAKIGLSESLK